MILPDKVRAEAKKKENENFKFRTFLKCHADEDELDIQFLRLHKELFADYDCSQCRNCYKMYKGSIPVEDIDRDAQHLEITPEQFIDTYLEKEEYDMNYQTKHKPCDFLQEDGNCKLGDCKPDSCKKYPYTDQPERLSSLLSILDTIEICPVAFEIFERLKQEYGFIYNVIDYCSQTQAVYDHLWNCSYPINELLHSFLDLFTGVKKYVVYY